MSLFLADRHVMGYLGPVTQLSRRISEERSARGSGMDARSAKSGGSHGTGCASHATAHPPVSASHQLDPAAQPDLEGGRDAEEQDDGEGMGAARGRKGPDSRVRPGPAFCDRSDTYLGERIPPPLGARPALISSFGGGMVLRTPEGSLYGGANRGWEGCEPGPGPTPAYAAVGPAQVFRAELGFALAASADTADVLGARLPSKAADVLGAILPLEAEQRDEEEEKRKREPGQ